VRDRYGREVSDLRISLTQRCNLRCVFCHMEGQPPSRAELTPAEIERAVRIAAGTGIDRVKLTGGEPTLRTDLVEIVARIAPLVDEVSMTTNGLLLETLAEPLHAAGLDRVNVSLPSMDGPTYQRLTGVDGADRAIRGIWAAQRAGLAPIKLNVVALAGLTDEREAVDRLVAFAQAVGAWVQLIEFENVRGRVDPRIYRVLHSELGRLREEAATQAFHTERNRLHGRPRYSFERNGRPVTLEVVQPVENPAFCMKCHRLRITSDGLLKGCLMTNAGLVDLAGAIRGGATDAELTDLFRLAVSRRRPFFTGPETPAPSTPDPVMDPMLEGTPLPMVAHPESHS
jgi:cyclic pyranopterin phosphate synthase